MLSGIEPRPRQTQGDFELSEPENNGLQPAEQGKKPWELSAYKKHKKKLAKLASAGLLNTYYNPQGATRARKLDVRKIMKGEDMYSVDEFITQIDDYFREIESRETTTMVASGETFRQTGKRPYTVEGLCAWLGISVQKFNMYENSEKYKEFNEIARFAKTVITDKIVGNAMLGEYNASFSSFYLVNHTKMTKDGEGNAEKKKVRPTQVVFVTCKSRADVPENIEQLRESIDVSAEVVKNGS